jgi:amyloid beta precursor protein binding protein 1
MLRGSVEDILNDPKIDDHTETSPFWLLASALNRFYNANKTLPVAGTLPDMTSTTDFYLDLQRIY